MSEELIQIVDPMTREPTGELVPRREIFEKKLWCRSTNIFVLNSEGQVLCHQRSLSKERFPGVWSTHFGGHVTVGESFKINAVKEIEEEIGLPVNMFQMIPWRTSRKEDVRLWMRDFVTVYDSMIENLTIQKSEIEHVRFMSISEIIDSVKNPEHGLVWEEMAGVYQIEEDYQALRAVLTACLDIGIFGGPFTQLKHWNPLDLMGSK